MPRRSYAGACALVSVLALPAAAHAAPTIQPLKPCYVTARNADEPPRQEGVQIAAAGFTPNSQVTLTLDGQPYPGGEALQVGPTGALPMAPVPAPFVEAGSREFTITLTEQGNPANTVSATARSAALDVTVTPRSARPASQVRFDGLGFTEDKPVYLHYVRNGELRKTVRVARRPGVCGGFSKRRRQLPVRKPGLGRWVLQFDQSRRLVDPQAATFVYVRLGIRLRLVPRSRPGR